MSAMWIELGVYTGYIRLQYFVCFSSQELLGPSIKPRMTMPCSPGLLEGHFLVTTSQTVPRNTEKHHSSIILLDPFVSRGRINTTQLASQVQREKTSTAKFLKTPTITVILIPSAALATPAGGRFSRLEGELGCLICFKVVSLLLAQGMSWNKHIYLLQPSSTYIYIYIYIYT